MSLTLKTIPVCLKSDRTLAFSFMAEFALHLSSKFHKSGELLDLNTGRFVPLHAVTAATFSLSLVVSHLTGAVLFFFNPVRRLLLFFPPPSLVYQSALMHHSMSALS